mmetsp:Transcript_39834/g.55322  ORF Transcript_39834/g.55322 Transcript_39834/m.55322 type:complete len:692 (+) Transcript_39834:144-2219(+)|eukprot:CAMPEP_0196580714 /NCGR_PEP_ID=MMETSP1081-20130531/30224_1 /TAXON_ID=36882 /ORGANISM="Pyramimonas amylifera, Strain CCMP720" /LENGTH=691 /DNA_ID=CAMNT_0041900669 /DNA_START=139 /DNA_END=2214 /DNA_ORIENTATION=+
MTEVMMPSHAGLDYTNLSLDEVVLPEGDDMGIPSDDDESAVEEVVKETGFGNVIVVDNLPVVPPAKCDKLITVVTKIFSQLGAIREGGLYMPKDEATQNSKGYAFIEYADNKAAEAALKQTQGYKLDKNHVFTVNMFDDFEKYSKVHDSYTALDRKEYQPRDNLQSWMMDDRGRDQFAIRWGDETEIYWNDAAQKRSEEVYRRANWTESFVQWSPQGSFLTTVHRQGVAMWGGENWGRVLRLDHPQVEAFDYSPQEKFLITCSSKGPEILIKAFNLRDGSQCLTIQGPIKDYMPEGATGSLQWPLFKWAGGDGDKYFARMGRNQIVVYSSETMEVLEGKPLKLEAVQDFGWCPTQDILSVYQPEIGNQPARICLIEIPSRQEIRQKNLFSVSEVAMYWQSSGSYLAVKVDRFTKTRKTTYTGFELFRVAERECPMEVLELDNKSDKIISFTWEPNGHRFAIIHGDGPRPDVSFYTMKDKLGRIKKLGTLKAKSVNQIFWSPQGNYIVMAGFKFSGELEFFSVDEMESLATMEHFSCNEVTWDPTGRYVTSSVTSVHQMDNGFNVWSFNGKLLYRTARDRFYAFHWRPRIPSLLSEEQEAEIVKNLKTYSRKFDSLDEELKVIQDSADMEEKRALAEEYNQWRANKVLELENEAPARAKLTAHLVFEAEDQTEVEEVTVEEIVDIFEEILSM